MPDAVSLTIFNRKSAIDNFLAGVAELVDAQDLKSCGPQGPCRFKSDPRHEKGFRVFFRV